VTSSASRMAPGPILSPQVRVWAPFTDHGPHLPFSKRYDLRESFYCHGYRDAGEHYHKTRAEMDDCRVERLAA
jgi:hypothetical protein